MVLIKIERICMVKGDRHRLRVWFDGNNREGFVFEGKEAETILNIIDPSKETLPGMNYGLYEVSV